MEPRNNDLLDFVSTLSGGDGVRVEESLGSGYVRLRVAEAERRQAQHDIRCVEDAVVELLRNARDAGARHILVGISREGSKRTVIVVDDGIGIPPSLHDRVFEARVTSKLDSLTMDSWGVHGRGMALFSIRSCALEARVCSSRSGCGCAIKTVFDTTATTERADQSTWPRLTKEEGQSALRGPRNIPRICTEFALQCADRCNVYVGSFSEVLATMRWLGERCDSDGVLHDSELLTLRASRCRDARELLALGVELGMDMSERTAHRVIRQDIGRLRNARAIVEGIAKSNVTNRAKPDRIRRTSLTEDDRAELTASLRSAFSILEERYYLELCGEPRIRQEAGRIIVTFDYNDANGGT